MNDNKFVSTFLSLISQGLNYMDSFTQTHAYTPTQYVTNRLPLMVLQGPLLAHTCIGNGVLWCYASLCSQLPFYSLVCMQMMKPHKSMSTSPPP